MKITALMLGLLLAMLSTTVYAVKCPDSQFESSGTNKNKQKAQQKAFQNAQKQCEIKAPGCPMVDVKNETEHHDSELGWTIELKFKCLQGP